MKKYFMKGTDDEVLAGDMIEVVLTGEEDGVRKHSHLEVKFYPEYADELIKEDIIEEREVEDDLIDFDSPCEALEGLVDKVGELEERIEDLEQKLSVQTRKIAQTKEVLDDCIKEVKNMVVKVLEETPKKTVKKK